MENNEAISIEEFAAQQFKESPYSKGRADGQSDIIKLIEGIKLGLLNLPKTTQSELDIVDKILTKIKS